MTTVTISESGMDFGPFNADHCFEVEKCSAYLAIQNDTKIAEFVWLREDYSSTKIWIVEAKSSSPQSLSSDLFIEFIHEIRDKLVNALTMTFAACLNRPQSARQELSDTFKQLDLSLVDVRFILVVKGHKKEWLPPLQDTLSKALAPTVKTWGITHSGVLVLNEDMARHCNLIQ